MLKQFISLVVSCTLLAACASNTTAYATKTHSSKTTLNKSAAKQYHVKGVASWYGKQFNHKRTSSGERYNMYKLTAAHKTLPLNTYVKVTNLKNGKDVIVKINDRGPFIKNRTIDLSYAAAKQIGMVNRGVTPVEIKVVSI